MNPYDADAALEAIRPRLVAAKARRRRSVGASAAAAVLAMSSVAYATVGGPADPGPTMVATDDARPAETAPATTVPVSGDDDELGPGAGDDVAPAPAPPAAVESPANEAPPDEVVPAEPPAPAPTDPPQPQPQPAVEPKAVEPPPPPKPQPPPPEPKPTTTTAPPPKGDAEADPDAKDRACTVPPGTSSHAAPAGAGSMTVLVDGAGRLSLVSATPSAGWTSEVYFDQPDRVKVGFRRGPDLVWVLVKVHDCTLKVESG